MPRLPRRPLHFGVLYLPQRPPLVGLLQRTALAVTLIVLVAVFLWVTRSGLRDNTHPDRPLGFVSVLYFTVVSLTTVGYGDIVPVTADARLVNAVLLTPIRVFLWALFLGTAYELYFERYRERKTMQQLRERLDRHTIVCGFGVVGRSIVAELRAHGHATNEIVVIDPNEAAAQEATAQGLVALRGDASSEAILHAAAASKASHVLVAPGRDDACVLICLTVRNMSTSVRLVASVREEENVKLLYRAGADVVIAPSVSGGRLMATAVRQHAVTDFLEDLLSFGRGVDPGEHIVTADEVGQTVHDLPHLSDALVLGVARGVERCPFHQMGHWTLRAGDVVVYLRGSDDRANGN